MPSLEGRADGEQVAAVRERKVVAEPVQVRAVRCLQIRLLSPRRAVAREHVGGTGFVAAVVIVGRGPVVRRATVFMECADGDDAATRRNGNRRPELISGAGIRG